METYLQVASKVPDGKVLDIIETGEPSNPVLAGSGILLGESESVSSLMQLDPARLLLRRQIANDPAAAERVLALAELGIQSGDTNLILEAASIFSEGFSEARFSGVRQVMLDLLLEYEASLDADSANMAAGLLDAAESISIEPGQLAAVLFARGMREFNSDQPRSALLFWAEILDDPTLSRQMVTIDTLKINVARLIASKIRSSTATLDLWNAMCAGRYEELKASDRDVDVDMVRAFMGSDVGIELLWRIQAEQAEQADVVSSRLTLSHISSLEPGVEVLQDIIDVLESGGRREDAARLRLMVRQ